MVPPVRPSAQRHFVDHRAGLLIDGAQSVAAFEQQSLRDENRRALSAAPLAGIDARGLQRGIVHDVVRRFSIRNHPGMIARVEIDGSDPPVGSLDKRQRLGLSIRGLSGHDVPATQTACRDVLHLRARSRPLAAMTRSNGDVVEGI